MAKLFDYPGPGSGDSVSALKHTLISSDLLSYDGAGYIVGYSIANNAWTNQRLDPLFTVDDGGEVLRLGLGHSNFYFQNANNTLTRVPFAAAPGEKTHSGAVISSACFAVAEGVARIWAIWSTTPTGSVEYSDDGGTTWTVVATGYTAAATSLCVSRDGTHVAVFSVDTSIERLYVTTSTNSGATWSATHTVVTVSAGFTIQTQRTAWLADNTLVCARYDDPGGLGGTNFTLYIQTSADNGATWATKVTQATTNIAVRDVSVTGSKVYFAVEASGTGSYLYRCDSATSIVELDLGIDPHAAFGSSGYMAAISGVGNDVYVLYGDGTGHSTQPFYKVTGAASAGAGAVTPTALASAPTLSGVGNQQNHLCSRTSSLV